MIGELNTTLVFLKNDMRGRTDEKKNERFKRDPIW